MNKFWMVWMEGNRDPQFKHECLSSAENEAERLARLYPGKKLYILETVNFCKVSDVVWWAKRSDDMEAPF